MSDSGNGGYPRVCCSSEALKTQMSARNWQHQKLLGKTKSEELSHFLSVLVVESIFWLCLYLAKMQMWNK